MKFINILLILCTTSVMANPSNIYTIDSDTQQFLANGNLLAKGRVHVVNEGNTIDADEAEYHADNPDNKFLTANGNPIIYKGITVDGKPFTGRSKHLKYIVSTGDVYFIEGAIVQQGESVLSAAIIKYNVNTKMIAASDNSEHRVKSIIHSEKHKATKK